MNSETTVQKVKMLGYFTLYAHNEKVINITSPKIIALLTYLIFYRNTSLSRNKLAQLLWGNCDKQHAMGSLRQHIAKLRPLLPEHCLEISHNYLVLNTKYLDVDIDVFHQLSLSTRIENSEKMIQLHQGELLKDFSSISMEFDAWLMIKRIESTEKMRSAADKLLKYYSQHNMTQKALVLARFILTFDEFNEDAHYSLMKIYIQQQRRSDAIIQYRSYQRLLNDELSIEPNIKLTKLHDNIVGSSVM